MDKIQDFFKGLRSRFSSPFFSSLLLAWLIINWRVPVGLLFYKLPELLMEEHTSYIGLIGHTVTLKSGVLWPVVAAICYTVIAPVLKNLI